MSYIGKRSDIGAEIGNACYAQPSTSAHRWLPPRIDLPDIARHIVQRSNDSQACFAQDNDYGAYLLELGEAALKHSCEIRADVQMIHHVHLLATPAERGALSRMTQAISRRYVGRSNARHRSTGASCEGLYKASLVGDGRYASACYRYIELNPARASMAALLSDYHWSSHAPMHWATKSSKNRYIRSTLRRVYSDPGFPPPASPDRYTGCPRPT